MADQLITLRIPEEHLTMAGDTMNGLANKRIDINAHGGYDNDPPFNANWNFEYESRQDGEGQKAFAQRYVKTLFKAFAKMYDYAVSQGERRDEVALIPPASENVPDDIITDIIVT